MTRVPCEKDEATTRCMTLLSDFSNCRAISLAVVLVVIVTLLTSDILANASHLKP